MSTYSTNLGIELIGTGDQAGTWGTTTNTNLGTLIEQAISGYSVYSCTGAIDIITIPDGATGEARNMFLELTGTGGGTLVVPAKKKLYFIYNNTASAITVKVSGQTGVSVPAAKKMLLVNNGTDIVLATNYMVGDILGNVTGNVTGSAGSVANTLTLGSYLTGTSFNGSSAVTATVDATSANTASKVVARDASGNFSAGTITATLSGNATSATTATSATSATTATNATNLATTNFTVQESGGKLVFKYAGTTIASLTSAGVFTAASNVSAYGSP